ncbi:hypothetical protein G6F65_020305 [Rhizopus arrhizus]|nr:hypothetical protein G6F65_020305 [Rhizopus arrhizus]
MHKTALVQADIDFARHVGDVVSPGQITPRRLADRRAFAAGHHVLEADPIQELAQIDELGRGVHRQPPIRPLQPPVARGIQIGRVVGDRQFIQAPLVAAFQIGAHHLKLAHVLAIQEELLGLQVDRRNIRQIVA